MRRDSHETTAAASEDRPRLVHITTVPVSLWAFLRGQIPFMREQGFDVHAISSPGKYLDMFAQRESVPVHAVEMPRRITPHRDIITVLRIWTTLRRIKPQIVHAHTPKGGLLGMIAAFLARVPVRVYHIHGLPFMTAVGTRRRILVASERVSCLLAHRVLCVSPSIRDVAITEHLCNAGKFAVLLGGSINGVDANGLYDPDRPGPSGLEVRAGASIPADALVVGFVGRVVRDKGIVELTEAWTTLRDRFPTLHLLIVGPFEPQDPVPEHVTQVLHNDPRVHLVGEVGNASRYYRAMDVVALPTYREGFPLVPLEAASMRLPVVATRVPGCVDAVIDGVTGTLVPPYNSGALADAIAVYLLNPALRQRHGEAGRNRVLSEFRQEDIWAATYQEYARLLRERGLPVPTPDGIAEATIHTGGR